MGSVLQLHRRSSIRRNWRKAPVNAEKRESANSILILVGTFGATAIAMSLVVVAIASNTWTDVVVMSAFVFVVALAKIVMANALFYMMIRSDAAAEAKIAAKAKTGAVFRRPVPTPPRPALKQAAAHRKTVRKIGSGKLASLSSRPRPLWR